MNFSIATTIRRLLAPRHELSISWLTWHRLVNSLQKSGKNFRRESGAFLLGNRMDDVTRIETFVPYDQLDPNALDSGIVNFDGRHFGALWDLCKRRNLTVVADVHTHPGFAEQSESDRTNPMISTAGHLALILPRFAARPIARADMGIYRYEGGKRWRKVPANERRAFFHIGL
jgi:hypothetical protein